MCLTTPISQRLALLLLLTICFVSCSREKTQRELYEDATTGVRFRTYKAASDAAVGHTLRMYNQERGDSLPELDPAFGHVLLGINWTVSAKPTLAFAEADLAEEQGDSTVQYLAAALRSIAMYEQGWDSLAHEESQRQHTMLKPGTYPSYEMAIFYMILGVAKAYDQDFAQSKFFWAGFANETDIHWPYKLTDAIDDLKQGRVQTGLGKLKALSQEPGIPPALQKGLADQIAIIESKTGDVNSRLFWPRLISGVVLEQLKTSSNEQVAAVAKRVDGLREKLL